MKFKDKTKTKLITFIHKYSKLIRVCLLLNMQCTWVEEWKVMEMILSIRLCNGTLRMNSVSHLHCINYIPIRKDTWPLGKANNENDIFRSLQLLPLPPTGHSHFPLLLHYHHSIQHHFPKRFLSLIYTSIALAVRALEKQTRGSLCFLPPPFQQSICPLGNVEIAALYPSRNNVEKET